MRLQLYYSEVFLT